MRSPRWARALAAALALAAFALLLAACGEGFGESEAANEQSEVAAATSAQADGSEIHVERVMAAQPAQVSEPLPPPAPAALVSKVSEPSVSVEREQVVEASVQTEALAAPAPAQQAQASSAAARRVIRSATLSLVVADVAASLRAVRGVVNAVPGAFVSKSDERGDDPNAVGSITVRVPVDRFDATLQRIRALGSQVISEAVTASDVTGQFTDVASRLRNAQATERQLQDILAQADSVEDILAVQAELAAVRERVEVLQGQLDLLTDQTDLSTITVFLHLPPDLRVERHPSDLYAMHQRVPLHITVENVGTVEVRALEVRDRLHRGMIFVEASAPGVYDQASHSVVWTLERLGAGGKFEVWSRVRLEGSGEPMQATAEARTQSLVRDAAMDRADLTLTFAVDLHVSKDGPTAVAVGRDVVYSLHYGNAGNVDAREVRLVERLPEGMTFVRADGGGRFDESQRAVVWEYPRVRPHDGGTVSYTARVERAGGRLQTETTIRSAEPDLADVDNQAVTFLTALPEEFADRDVWNPSATARDAVDALAAIGRWLANAAITVGIVAVPIAAGLAVIVLAVRVVHGRLQRTPRR